MKYIVMSLFAWSSLTANAQQKLPLLLRLDFGSSNVKTNTGKGEGAFAFGAGVETFVPVKKLQQNSALVLNPNLSFLTTGYETIVGGSVKVNYLSLGLPVCYEVFGLPDPNELGILFGAGPFINTAINGKFKVLANDPFKDVSFGNGLADNRTRTDAGLLLKSAIRVKKLYMGLQYNMGLKNVIPNDRISNDSYIRTRNFLFYASYAIGR